MMICPKIISGECTYGEEDCSHATPHEKNAECDYSLIDPDFYVNEDIKCPDCFSENEEDFLTTKDMEL